MNKPDFKKAPMWVIKTYRERSMTTQLIITIVLIFISFFVLQALLNSQFFTDYYTQQEYDKVHTELIDYVNKMMAEDADLYDIMFEYTSDKNVYTVTTTRDYLIRGSLYSQYTIIMEDSSTNETYRFVVPEITHEYTIGEIIDLEAYEYTNNNYSAISIETGSYTYNYGVECIEDDSCVTVSGPIVGIEKPSNLNSISENAPILRQELTKLSIGEIKLEDIEYEEGYHHIENNNDTDYMIFIHNRGDFDYIITAIPLQDSVGIIKIMNNYNNYVYLTAFIIIFLWSFRINSIISTPVQNIEKVAKEIAQLNFNVEANETNNRENTSLSNSINLIARNLKETLDTLSSQNDELMKLYDEQVKQVTLKKQLVSSISHELKTPLMIMQVTIQGILDGIIPVEDQETELNNVIDEINKSSIMIQDMLQIYRLEDANTTLELSEFNLSETVQFFMNDFEKIIKKHKFAIDLNIDSKVVVEADSKLIKRCISNFITNAIRYTPNKERMYIEVSEDETHAYFELSNYGVNIPSDELENIWIPFFRGQNSSKNQKLKTKGSGIGLYLVSEILKAHKADFDIINIDNGVKAYFKVLKRQN